MLSGDDKTDVKTIYLFCSVYIDFHACLFDAERIRATCMLTTDNSRNVNCHYNTSPSYLHAVVMALHRYANN